MNVNFRKLPLKDFVTKYFNEIFITLLGFFIYLKNLPAKDQYFIGWDNLQVELNYFLNLKRNVFAAWQEYQGLGLAAGHAHAVESIRLLIFFPLYLLVPNHLFRYSFHILLLIIGGLFVSKIVKKYFVKNGNVSLALFGGIFYMCNWLAIQNFYAALEPFSAFYGFFPLVIYYLFEYLNKNNRFNLLKLSFSFLLLSLSYHIQTFFVVSILAIFIPLFFYAIAGFIEKSFLNFKKAFLTGLSFMIVNLYWLGSAIYFYATNVSIRFESVSNRIASEDSFLQNVDYANIKDILLMRGFWFKNIDYQSSTNKFGYMMQPWLEWVSNHFVISLAYLFAVLLVVGICVAIYKHTKKSAFTIYLLLLSVFFLFNVNGPTGWLYEYISYLSPTFKEMFRFPFTKWSGVYSLSFTLILCLGLDFILAFICKLLNEVGVILTKYLSVALLLFTVFIYSYPIFKGQLIYQSLKLKIPHEYFQLFEYFKEQPKEMRIANLPQPNFWGWYFTTWGYRGSGFLWYGIEQPILDRAFDVWNIRNEHYYKEFQYALYAEDTDLLNELTDKYDIDFLILDRNVVVPEAPRATFYEATIKLLDTDSKFKLDAKYGNLFVYKKITSNEDYSFLSAPSKIILGHKSEGNYIDSSLKDETDYSYIDDSHVYGISDEDIANSINNTNGIFIDDPRVSEKYTLKTSNLVDESKVPAWLTLETDKTLSLEAISPIMKNRNGVVLNRPNIEVKEDLSNFPDDLNEVAFLLDGRPAYLGLGSRVSYLLDADSKFIAYNKFQESSLNIGSDIYSAEVTDCGVGSKVFGKDYPPYPGSVSISSEKGAACLDFNDQISVQVPSIIKVQFEYKNTDQAFPYYCLLNELKTQCANNKYGNSPVKTGKFTKYEDFSYIEPGTNYQLELINETFNGNDLQMVAYKNISLSVYPVVGKIDGLGTLLKTSLEPVSTSVSGSDFPLSISLDSYIGFNRLYKPGSTFFNANAMKCDLLGSSSYERVFSETNKSYRYSALDSSSCDSLDARIIDTSASYLVSFNSGNLDGKGLDVCIAAKGLDKCLVQDRLNQNEKVFVLPPYPAAGAVNVNILNQSIGKDLTINNLSSIDISYIPYKTLRSISISPEGFNETRHNSISIKDKYKSGTHYYRFKAVSSSTKESDDLLAFVELNQSFDKGWVLYDKATCILGISTPLTCQKAEAEHVLAKNWANGWLVPSKDAEYVIIFWPQYLQFLGYLIPIAVLSIIVFLSRKPLLSSVLGFIRNRPGSPI